MPLTRDALRQLLALPPPAVPHVEVLEETSIDGGVRKRVRYRGHREPVPAFLLEPTRPHGGAVLIQHQHASRWHQGKSEVAGLVGEPLQAFAPALAAQGWTVLAPDAPGFEDRRPGGPGTDQRPDDWRQYHNAMAYRLVRGELLLTEAIGDLQVAIGVLGAHPDVDAARIGFLGHSHGGNLGQWLAAADPRLAFTCVSGSTCSYRHKLAHGTGLEFTLIVPSVLDHLDVEDLVRLVRPRPLLVVAGLDDPYSADAADVLGRAGLWEGVELLSVPGEHALDQTRHDHILAWIARQI